MPLSCPIVTLPHGCLPAACFSPGLVRRPGTEIGRHWAGGECRSTAAPRPPQALKSPSSNSAMLPCPVPGVAHSHGVGAAAAAPGRSPRATPGWWAQAGPTSTGWFWRLGDAPPGTTRCYATAPSSPKVAPWRQPPPVARTLPYTEHRCATSGEGWQSPRPMPLRWAPRRSNRRATRPPLSSYHCALVPWGAARSTGAAQAPEPRGGWFVARPVTKGSNRWGG